MAPPSNQPVWLRDEERRLRYYIHPQDGARVYENGTRVPRPNNEPRVPPQAIPSRLPQAQAPSGASPPGNDSQFAFGGPDSRLGPQRPTAGNRPLAAGPSTRSGPQNPTPGHDSLAAGIAGLQIDGPTTTPFHPGAATLESAGPTAPIVSQSDRGVRVVIAQNPTSRVTTTIGTGPPERITDPYLYGQGIRVRRAIYGNNGNEGEQEPLFSNFRIRRHDFFTRGRVFMILWSEPFGETTTNIGSVIQNDRSIPGLFLGRHGERVYSKVRKFVITREGSDFCTAVPVVTYGAQGVSKFGVTKFEHGIIYTGPAAPEPLPAELPTRGERAMSATPIRVTPDAQGMKLDEMSRIDYAKPHTIEHNLKVAAVGVVHPASMEALITQFRSVWLDQPTDGPNPNAAVRGAASGSTRSTVPRTGSSGNTSSQSTRATAGGSIREEDESRAANAAAGPRALPRRNTADTNADAAQAAVRSAPAPINGAEVEMIRTSIRNGMRQGQSQAAVMEAIRQRYLAAGHPPERTLALIRAALAPPARPAGSQ
ncbi:hypothetical protein LTR91_005541 [Friedmanniomyces endolithicus]|nr:hypothetical protein LTR57_008192 [Friedmanniomyces endolithicus]KAK1000970.1 hypothetical protein LTR91_005541 [Friedmanniomyces endolithicus]KAK1014076.1 hypothetical protein LTS01_000606 [Friedmanniomyces endolithicus]KAK1045525.1 hypothetical protein LTS16_006508 [Friedmanniomyces endolithicus]